MTPDEAVAAVRAMLKELDALRVEDDWLVEWCTNMGEENSALRADLAAAREQQKVQSKINLQDCRRADRLQADLAAARAEAEALREALTAWRDWWDLEDGGPNYPDGQGRDTPNGEQFYREWRREVQARCGRADELMRAALKESPDAD